MTYYSPGPFNFATIGFFIGVMVIFTYSHYITNAGITLLSVVVEVLYYSPIFNVAPFEIINHPHFNINGQLAILAIDNHTRPDSTSHNFLSVVVMNQPQQSQHVKMMASATILLTGLFFFVLYQSGNDVSPQPQFIRSSNGHNIREAASSSRSRRVSSASLRAKTGCGLWHPSVGEPKTWYVHLALDSSRHKDCIFAIYAAVPTTNHDAST